MVHKWFWGFEDPNNTFSNTPFCSVKYFSCWVPFAWNLKAEGRGYRENTSQELFKVLAEKYSATGRTSNGEGDGCGRSVSTLSVVLFVDITSLTDCFSWTFSFCIHGVEILFDQWEMRGEIKKGVCLSVTLHKDLFPLSENLDSGEWIP